MTKLIHLSDLGLKNLPYGGINPSTGLNKRFEDVYNNLRYVASNAIKNEVEYIILAGDINEERNPESILIEKFSEIIADLISCDIKIIMIAGNHDLDGAKGTSSSISYIKALGLVNTYIADLGPEKFEFDDVVFHCVPYMFPSQVGKETNDELSQWLSTYINSIKMVPTKSNILVSHYSMSDTFGDYGVDEPVLNYSDLARFDYVALGHIHKYDMFTNRPIKVNGGYSGSMFCKDFGEQNDKYYNMLTIKDRAVTFEKKEIPERLFKKFEFDYTENYLDELEFQKHFEENVTDIKDAIVKVIIRSYKRFNPKLIYDYIKQSKAFYHAPIEWKIKKFDNTFNLDVSNEITDKQIFNQFLDNQMNDVDSEIKPKVKDYVSGIIDAWENDLSVLN